MNRTERTTPCCPSRRAFALGGFVLAGGALMLAGCTQGQGSQGAGAPQGGEPAPKKLVMAIPTDPDGLDPQRTAAAATFQITNNIYDALLKVTTAGELVAGLASAWKVSPDGMSVTFTLREGATFSNGNPCDAAAVVASFERLVQQDSPRRSQYEGYSFEVLDEVSLRVTSESLNVAMLTDFAYAWSAVVDVTAADDLAHRPVGTGAYVVDSWTPQQSVAMSANPRYWGDPATLEKVELRVLPEATTRQSALRAGDIDLMLATSEQVEGFEHDEAFEVMPFSMNGVQLMAMNCENPVLSDARVRQAIVMAVNKDELIDAVWWGFGEKIGSHFPPSVAGYVDCNDTYPYDPQAARELLDECGYGADELTFSMRLPKAYQEYVDAGQVIADALKKVGVTCDVQIIEWAEWLDEVYTARRYDLTVVGHTGRLDPITLLARYESSSSENYFNYASDEVDALIGAYRGELDEQERIACVEGIQRELAKDVPALYLQSPVMVYIARAGLSGFALYPIDIYEFKNMTL